MEYCKDWEKIKELLQEHERICVRCSHAAASERRRLVKLYQTNITQPKKKRKAA